MVGAGFTSGKTWHRGQTLLRLLLIALCALVIFAPKLTEPSRSQPSGLALSSVNQNYTLLAVPQRTGGELYRLKNSQAESFRRSLWTVSPLASLGAFRLLAPVPHTSTLPVSTFDNIHQGPRRICLLLDKPPPFI